MNAFLCYGGPANGELVSSPGSFLDVTVQIPTEALPDYLQETIAVAGATEVVAFDIFRYRLAPFSWLYHGMWMASAVWLPANSSREFVEGVREVRLICTFLRGWSGQLTESVIEYGYSNVRELEEVTEPGFDESGRLIEGSYRYRGGSKAEKEIEEWEKFKKEMRNRKRPY